MIVVTVVICRLTQKYAQMQHPLFGYERPFAPSQADCRASDQLILHGSG